jgi:DNA-binding SARP family transcriptional activator
VTTFWENPAAALADAQFRILGPLEVVLPDGRPVPIPARGERALLSVLLLFEGQLCSQEMLTRALWADRLPEHPDKALQVTASRLRKSLGPANCLTRVPGSYRAVPPPDSTDIGRFRTLRAEAASRANKGNPLGAARALESALAYWRQPPLAALPSSPDIDAEAECLLEQRRQAELDLTDLLLRLGEHERIVPDLYARVIVDPGSDRAWQQLILGLHLSGRRSDALVAFGEARKTLAEGYGTRPTEGLQATLRIVLGEAPPRASRPSGIAAGISLPGPVPAFASPPGPDPPAAASARRRPAGNELSLREPGPSGPG